MIETVIDMRPPEATELTTADRAELGRYEAVIRRGLDTFFEVGNALAKIRDGKLYRGEYDTFDEYCRGRWDFTDRRARMLIDAAEVVGNLESGTIVPVNEAQARPLTRLDPDQQREAWQEAVESAPNGKPTAAHVEKAVAKFSEPKAPQPKPEPVNYAPVYALENKVNQWLRDVIGENGQPSAGTVLANVKLQMDEPHSPGNWLDMLGTYVAESLTYRKKDLHQAINNVREQRRVAERQAQARKVYLGPVAKTEPEPVAPTPDQARWQAEVEAELAPELQPASDGLWPAGGDGILTREWIMHILTSGNPRNADFATALNAASEDELDEAFANNPADKAGDARSVAIAERRRVFQAARLGAEPQPAPQLPVMVELMIDPRVDDTTTLPNSLHWAIKQATVDELNEALRLLPDSLAGGRGPVLEAALKKRGGVAAMMTERASKPTPDPRLEDARALVDLLVAARDTARAHYGELTGQHTDMLEFERGVAAMLPPLERLIAVLEGTE